MFEKTKKTPEQIQESIKAAQEKTELRHQKNETFKKMLEDCKVHVAKSVEIHNLRFLHIRKHKNDSHGDAPFGGCTVAYAPVTGKRQLTFSAVTCSDKDLYCRAIGASEACKAFRQANVLTLTLPKKMKPAELLARMFMVFTD